jgi:hypothetical protein
MANILDVWRPGRSNLVQILTIIAVLLGLSLLVFVWAAFFRKPGGRHRHHRYRYPQSTSETDAQSKPPEKPAPTPRRKRFRRHEHRPRNPTLAEAGGLPPARADEPAPPPSEP